MYCDVAVLTDYEVRWEGQGCGGRGRGEAGGAGVWPAQLKLTAILFVLCRFLPPVNDE